MSAGVDRIQELLAEKAIHGLPSDQSAELDRLLRFAPEWNDESYERAAAAIDLAFDEGAEPLPDSLRARIQHDLTDVARAGTPAAGSGGWSQRFGWLAAAASLLLALAGWWPRLAGDSPSPPAAVAPAEEQRYAWQATDDPAAAGAAGEVIWRSGAAGGEMVFRGLAPNDPAVSQYQLWIFDSDRDDRYPVDGGVFDIPAGRQEVVVPIDPKLTVEQPTLFAVTVEQPGGVVVSDRERIVLLARV